MDFEVPAELKYTDEHEWYDPESGWMGITDYAQEMIGDVVFVELPAVGEELEAGGSFTVIESMKTVSDVYAPVTGEIVEVNSELNGAPENVNEAPYETGRLVRIETAEANDELMDAAEYEAFLKEQD